MIRYSTTSPDVYAFSRTLPDSEVVVIANLSEEEAPLQFTGVNFAPAVPDGSAETEVSQGIPSFDGYLDYFDGVDVALPSTLAPWQYFILVRK